MLSRSVHRRVLHVYSVRLLGGPTSPLLQCRSTDDQHQDDAVPPLLAERQQLIGRRSQPCSDEFRWPLGPLVFLRGPDWPGLAERVSLAGHLPLQAAPESDLECAALPAKRRVCPGTKQMPSSTVDSVSFYKSPYANLGLTRPQHYDTTSTNPAQTS